MKFLMGLLVALFMVSTAQAGKSGGAGFVVAQEAADSKSFFWNVKAGSVSTFHVTVDSEAGQMVLGDVKMEVVKSGDNNVVFKQTMGENSSKFGGTSSNGYYCWGPVDPATGKIKPVMNMFKYDAKAGDTWDGWAEKPSPDSPEVTVKCIATDEEVTTDAGKFKAIHVQASVKDGPTVDYYFVAGKGLVKLDTKVGDFTKHLTLSDFTEGK